MTYTPIVKLQVEIKLFSSTPSILSAKIAMIKVIKIEANTLEIFKTNLQQLLHKAISVAKAMEVGIESIFTLLNNNKQIKTAIKANKVLNQKLFLVVEVLLSKLILKTLIKFNLECKYTILFSKKKNYVFKKMFVHLQKLNKK